MDIDLKQARTLIGPDETAPTGEQGGATDSTRDRLLDAAERLFAERGYDGVSVRQVTAAAGCNIAAVNYHFGNKDGLYEEMYRRRLAGMRERRIHGLQKAVEAGGDLRTVLTVFATVFFEPLLEQDDRGAILLKLWMQELTSQHLPPRMLMEELVRPVTTVFTSTLMAAVPGLSEGQARMCIHSFVGQLVHIVMCEPIYGDQDYQLRPLGDVEAAVGHVVRFSEAGIRAVAGESSTDTSSEGRA